jgi:hypothetical protein
MKVNVRFLSLCLIITFLALDFIHAQEKPEVQIGGALRYNYNLSLWKTNQVKRGGDFGFNVFRINAKAAYKDIKLNVEYRLYDSYFGGGILKQGWVQYDVNDQANWQLGLMQVPFGNTPYNSHSWFFSMDYYVGIEDDYDMGIKYSKTTEKLDWALAFFKNAEEITFSNLGDLTDNRYAYDIGSYYNDDLEKYEYRNKEVNQGNIQAVYKVGNHRIGGSLLYGGVLNLDTEKIGNRFAYALHYQLASDKLSVKAEFTQYEINQESPVGERSDIVAMAAYGAPYFIAAKASVLTLGVGYTIPVSFGPVSSIQVYEEFGTLAKNKDGFENTLMNDFGFLITAGSVYTYIDFASGKNQPWLGGDWTKGLAEGVTEADWETRININIGYYF